MNRERILVTNDDGINSRGLDLLINIAKEFGDVIVVAPEESMSGMSHSISMYKPLFLRSVEQSEGVAKFACNGTPVDCVKLAADAVMLKNPPTLVLSGINHGANTNLSVIYSGTMGAACEGSTYNVPSIGFSLVSHDVDADLTASEHYVREVIKMVLRNREAESICLNVNIPNIPLSEIKGIKFCRQTKGYWREDFQKRYDPHGREYYWLVGSFINTDDAPEEGDDWAISNGYVSIVPVLIDVTDYSKLAKIKNWTL
ncbi:MAG: 5'/3'-nucleotidase SurE [Rikenellaceae bacterium]